MILKDRYPAENEGSGRAAEIPLGWGLMVAARVAETETGEELAKKAEQAKIEPRT